ncbi:uncharacterized protein [Asterias amurensis]|uniref:uncharacterized protein n=1 Tax=Asterias amurensis TaxID=7602 RepID=UPI003AB305E2
MMKQDTVTSDKLTLVILVMSLGVLLVSDTVTSLYTEGDVRLQGVDNSALQGRLEVYHEGAWVSVCDPSWDIRKGDVVCRQLGFSGGAMSTDTNAVFGQGTSTSWLTDVTCSGNENSLTECMDLTYGTNMCSHGTDVGVRCTYPMYEGCYVASFAGPLVDNSIESQLMTISLCLELCRGYSKNFAGVQGAKCTCGDDISSGAKQGNSGCHTVCPGDASEACGGTATVSIYRTGSFYRNAANTGGYITSANFPYPYLASDAFPMNVPIPSEFNFAVVSFSYFKIAAEDRVVLKTPGGTPRSIAGTTGGDLPAFWNSEQAASFTVEFVVGSTTGDTGFVMQYTFGLQCSASDLPDSIVYGQFAASQTSYFYNDEVVVNCNFGYQRDKESFLCQTDGTWSTAPVCSLIPTTVAPTTEASLATTGLTTPAWTGVVPTGAGSTPMEAVPCPIPVIQNGTVDSQGLTQLTVGQTITVTCDDTFEAADGTTEAMCIADGSYDNDLVCSPKNNVPIWLISVIVVAAVLAIIVIVLIILVALVSMEPKQPASRGRRPHPSSEAYGNGVSNGDGGADRLVAIAPSVMQGQSPRSSLNSRYGLGAVNQGAQTEDDPAVAELTDPMAGDNDVYHPTRDYPGAGAKRPGSQPVRPPPATLSPPPLQPMPPQRQVSMEYRPNGDFSMLANDELLAVGALDSVVQDFERDQAYFLGPTSPGMYGMDRRGGSRYGSRQIQFSQRSRLNNFYGLY